jgi:phosphoribosyl-ATP pyrophosphohydrolase/phosphoribosyl-AMP cyclohydrolase/histidinol dehydrogenase
MILRPRPVEELVTRSPSIRPDVNETAAAIVDDVRSRGEAALREHAERLDGLESGAPLVLGREEMERALRALPPDAAECLTRVARRIVTFAEGQRRSLGSFEMSIPGGRAGHEIVPVTRAGCYAPGGRYPLPSSVLMTALTARAAGVPEIWITSPHPDPIMLACGALAGATGFVRVGGAQAVAAMAFGAGPVPACDVIVGPGNAFVTAAKRHVVGQVGIDTLAGPSELVVLADERADPVLVVADLLAQAEHDPLSVVVLVSLSERLVHDVNQQLERQLTDLPTADVARVALENGGAVLVGDAQEAVVVCNQLAPEHLQLHVTDPDALRGALRNYGALFLGHRTAEVLGDYGAGPNHVLPTGRASRFSGGLSVMSFLRVRTWLQIDDEQAAAGLYEDAAWFARKEGLLAHAHAAELRLRKGTRR